MHGFCVRSCQMHSAWNRRAGNSTNPWHAQAKFATRPVQSMAVFAVCKRFAGLEGCRPRDLTQCCLGAKTSQGALNLGATGFGLRGASDTDNVLSMLDDDWPAAVLPSIFHSEPLGETSFKTPSELCFSKAFARSLR